MKDSKKRLSGPTLFRRKAYRTNNERDFALASQEDIDKLTLDVMKDELSRDIQPLFSQFVKIGEKETEYTVEFIYPDWISVEDRLPKEEGFYLVAYQYYEETLTVESDSYRQHYRDGMAWNQFKDNVKFWMPLPEPPK